MEIKKFGLKEISNLNPLEGTPEGTEFRLLYSPREELPIASVFATMENGTETSCFIEKCCEVVYVIEGTLEVISPHGRQILKKGEILFVPMTGQKDDTVIYKAIEKTIAFNIEYVKS